MERVELYLRAILLVALDRERAADDHEKPELLLARAGFTYQEVADLLGKNFETVKSSLKRSRKGRK